MHDTQIRRHPLLIYQSAFIVYKIMNFNVTKTDKAVNVLKLRKYKKESNDLKEINFNCFILNCH